MQVIVSDQQLRSWRRQGYSLERIASACNMTISQVSRRLRQIWRDCRQQSDPGLEEIKEACARIQREWSAAERAKREVGAAREWQPVAVPGSILALIRD